MTMTKSFPTQDPAGQPVTDTRRVFAGLVARNADGTPRPGILAPAATALVTGRASMAYDVAPFIAATARFNNGIELVANDALLQVATDPAPNANSRIDVIYVRSRFLQHADGSNLVELGVAKGLAAAIPQKPAIPAGALELAWATVPSTATTTLSNGVVITQTYQFTAAGGGAVPFRNRAEMDTWTAPDGALARDLSTGERYERIGTTWRGPDTGLRLLIPSSVTGGATLLPTGRILLTDGDSVVVNGVFSSRFRSYRIMADWQVAGGVNGAVFEMCAGGVASVTGYYQQSLLAAGNSTAGSYSAGITSFAAVPYAGNGHFIDFTLTAPALARDTYLDMRSHVPTAGLAQSTGYHQPSVSYDGFRLRLSSTGTGRKFLSGELAVYGIA